MNVSGKSKTFTPYLNIISRDAEQWQHIVNKCHISKYYCGHSILTNVEAKFKDYLNDFSKIVEKEKCFHDGVFP